MRFGFTAFDFLGRGNIVKSALDLISLLCIGKCAFQIFYIVNALDAVYNLPTPVMVIADEENSDETAGMVETLLLPSKVTAKGDETKLTRVDNVGLRKGGLASPALYNKTEKALIRRVLHALTILDDCRCPAPLKDFANGNTLQLPGDVAAEIVLRAAGY